MKQIAKLAFGFLLAASACFAQNETLQIESDKAHYFHEKGVMVHEGNVVVHWQDRVLYANNLTIYKSANGQVSHLIAKGKPASFHGKFADKAQAMQGQAGFIDFKLDDNIITLKENAQLNYDGDLFEGPVISFNFNSNSIVAEKNEKTRPKLTFGSRFTDKIKQN